jgi:membrane-bound ClpP family serine protease
MDPQLLVLILFVAGIVLIFAEFFVPSGGLIAVLCVLCFLGSIAAAYQAWGTAQPVLFWGYLGSLFFVIPGSIYGALQVLLRTPLAKRVFLEAPKPEEVTPFQQEMERLSRLIGQKGVTQSLMSPGGMVIVGGERLHAVADAMMIPPGEPIEIVAVQGTRVVVRRAEAPSAAGEIDLPIPPTPAEDDPFA